MATQGWVCAICGSSNNPSLRQCVCTDASPQTPATAHVVALGSRAKPKQQKARTYDYPGWEEFWETYPLKLDKAKGYDAYCAAVEDAGVEPQRIIAGAAAYAAHCRINRIEPGHIKYAQGWLNDERYYDETPLPPSVGETDPAFIVGTPEYDARIQAEEDAAIEAMSDE